MLLGKLLWILTPKLTGTLSRVLSHLLTRLHLHLLPNKLGSSLQTSLN